jgi:hypothetical protein
MQGATQLSRRTHAIHAWHANVEEGNIGALAPASM